MKKLLSVALVALPIVSFAGINYTCPSIAAVKSFQLTQVQPIGNDFYAVQSNPNSANIVAVLVKANSSAFAISNAKTLISKITGSYTASAIRFQGSYGCSYKPYAKTPSLTQQMVSYIWN